MAYELDEHYGKVVSLLEDLRDRDCGLPSRRAGQALALIAEASKIVDELGEPKDLLRTLEKTMSGDFGDDQFIDTVAKWCVAQGHEPDHGPG